jgi:hypothetical protein
VRHLQGSHLWLIAEPQRFSEVITNVLPVAEQVQAAQASSGSRTTEAQVRRLGTTEVPALVARALE